MYSYFLFELSCSLFPQMKLMYSCTVHVFERKLRVLVRIFYIWCLTLLITLFVKLKSYLISLIHFLDEIIKKPRIIISYCSFKIWSRLLDWSCQSQQRELRHEHSFLFFTWQRRFKIHTTDMTDKYTSKYLPRERDKDTCTCNWGGLAKSVWGEGTYLKGCNLRVLVSVCEFPWITGM